jgi:hypothetical protein
MPSASRDQIELREIAPGYSSRFTDWGGITVAFEKARAGQDASAMVRGLPDDRCQAPHWGFLFSGKIAVHFDDRTETGDDRGRSGVLHRPRPCDRVPGRQRGARVHADGGARTDIRRD